MYVKLFGKILDSSIWLEPHSTRIVWITLLAAMDQDGYAHFSALENLAGRARVSLEEAAKAVECFLEPDPNSGNMEHDGRRIERVPGGYFILNAAAHRSIMNKEIQREQTRVRTAKWRERKKSTGKRHNSVTHTSPTVTPAYASAYTSVSLKEKKLNKETVCEELGKNEAYKGIDIGREFGKMEAWCMVNHKEVTERRFVNWLNRVDRPMENSRPRIPGDAPANKNGDDLWAQLSEQDKKGLIHGK